MGPCFNRKLAAVLIFLNAMAIAHVRAQNPGDEKASRLEFRILADTKHDREAAEKARAADTVEKPPAGYRWIWLGETVTGSDPKVDSDRLSVPGARWKDDEFAGRTVQLTGKNLAGSDLTFDFEIAKNTADRLQLRKNPALFLKSVSSFRIDLTPSGVGVFPGGNTVLHEVADVPGRLKRFVLVKLDHYNVTEKDLARVYPTVDERFNPAVGFKFTRQGGDKFGALTKEHLPEDGGTFRYQIGIIMDGRLLSAPVILNEIREEGIILLGQNARPEEAERIIKVLSASSK